MVDAACVELLQGLLRPAGVTLAETPGQVFLGCEPPVARTGEGEEVRTEKKSDAFHVGALRPR